MYSGLTCSTRPVVSPITIFCPLETEIGSGDCGGPIAAVNRRPGSLRQYDRSVGDDQFQPVIFSNLDIELGPDRTNSAITHENNEWAATVMNDVKMGLTTNQVELTSRSVKSLTDLGIGIQGDGRNRPTDRPSGSRRHPFDKCHLQPQAHRRAARRTYSAGSVPVQTKR